MCPIPRYILFYSYIYSLLLLLCRFHCGDKLDRVNPVHNFHRILAEIPKSKILPRSRRDLEISVAKILPRYLRYLFTIVKMCPIPRYILFYSYIYSLLLLLCRFQRGDELDRVITSSSRSFSLVNIRQFLKLLSALLNCGRGRGRS